jgi:hypothetical protein
MIRNLMIPLGLLLGNSCTINVYRYPRPTTSYVNSTTARPPTVTPVTMQSPDANSCNGGVNPFAENEFFLWHAAGCYENHPQVVKVINNSSNCVSMRFASHISIEPKVYSLERGGDGQMHRVAHVVNTGGIIKYRSCIPACSVALAWQSDPIDSIIIDRYLVPMNQVPAKILDQGVPFLLHANYRMIDGAMVAQVEASRQTWSVTSDLRKMPQKTILNTQPGFRCPNM